MNGLSYHPYSMNRLLKWPVLCAFLSLIVAGAALATDPIYQNFSPINYLIPGNPPPVIDARAFDNESVYSISYNVYTANPEEYETMNTLFYTNNGTMIANSPITTGGYFFALGSVGTGFTFDQQVTNLNNQHLMADTFYNPGTIYCDSTNTGNNMLTFSGLSFGVTLFEQTSVGIFSVLATNIINPGMVDVGASGLMQFTGQGADFSHSTLYVEGSLLGQIFTTSGLLFNFFNSSQNFSATGFFGTDTNQDWDPGADLGPNFALSSFSGYTPVGGGILVANQLYLSNSASYFDVRASGTNGAIVRAVFLMDTSANMATNVYFQAVNGSLLGSGSVNVEWIGSYLNPATGQTVSNYLYLNDDYLLGASTNVFLYGGNGGANSGIPDNYTFTPSTTELLAGPTPSSFLNVFPNLVITNPYSYFNAQLIASTVATNKSASNPSGALTNLTGRIQITATKDLNLTQAQISGQNYMSLTATNQYEGSAGAQIDSPFSDINLGVTNGFMTISNLLAAGIPAWSGSVSAWSTRWTNTDVTGFTTDYRVLLVSSQLTPTTPPQVQTLRLHATNSLVISDTLNVFSSVYIDAQNLTLSTNLPGYGATSVDGELNWENTANFGTGFGQFPNLLWLTNNGAFRSMGFVQLGSAATSYGAIINNGLIADQGSTLYANNFLSSGTISNGIGNFLLQSQTTTITNGSVTANGDIAITTGSLLTSNLVLSGRSLTLQVTNSLTDTGPNPTNNSFWTVGGAHSLQFAGGFSLPLKPATGDLLGTTITNIALANYVVNNTWSGVDRGYSNSGYSNNAALGRLVLDALSTSSRIHFSGTGSSSNAIYVDCLVLLDSATNLASGNIPEFTFNPNLVIYYAQALQNGVSVAEKLNFANTNHFRWMPTYAGYYSSTNLVNPPGVTNTVNAALAASSDIDSDSDGTVNALDPTPFLVPAQLNFMVSYTNRASPAVQLQWTTIPRATNYVFYRTNLLAGGWLPFTNYNYYYFGSTNYPNTNHVNWFPSPQTYNPIPGTDNYQDARVYLFDTITNAPRYYQIEVNPWLLAP
jgi:hypothetical protein